MAEIQGDRLKRLYATNPRINPVPIKASTPVSGAAPGTTIGSINDLAGAAATAASQAQTSANTANTELRAITSDDVLSAGEKSAVILDYTTITAEQAGIDVQANAYGQSRIAYDSAVTALSSYLTSLAPVWNNTSVDTPIVGSTFRAKFADVYSARQALLNAISARAKALADSAQTTADYAATRPVGDYTAQVLANSGTNIQSYSSTLFTFVNGAFQLSIGAGGLVQSVGGVPKLSLSPLGSWFAGALDTDSYVYARGSNPVTIPGIGTVASSGYFINSNTGGYGVTGYAINGTGVVGVGNIGVMAYGSTYGIYCLGAAQIVGNADVTGNMRVPYGTVSASAMSCSTITASSISASYLSGSLSMSELRPGTQGSFSFSGDGGATWTPILIRRD